MKRTPESPERKIGKIQRSILTLGVLAVIACAIGEMSLPVFLCSFVALGGASFYFFNFLHDQYRRDLREFHGFLIKWRSAVEEGDTVYWLEPFGRIVRGVVLVRDGDHVIADSSGKAVHLTISNLYPE